MMEIKAASKKNIVTITVFFVVYENLIETKEELNLDTKFFFSWLGD